MLKVAYNQLQQVISILALVGWKAESKNWKDNFPIVGSNPTTPTKVNNFIRGVKRVPHNLHT